MGKSKRSKVIHLTKTKKKAPDSKKLLVDKIRNFYTTFDNKFVFSYQNMTTNPFRALQAELEDSKFCLGKNKIMKIALGKGDEDSFDQVSFKLSEHLNGECGLLFTNRTVDEVQELFDNFSFDEFAKAGEISPQTIVLERGSDVFKKFSHSIEPHLRKLGLQTQLNNAQIELHSDYLLAQEGVALNTEQCKILRLLEIKLSEFKMKLLGVCNSNGFKELD